MAIYPEFKDKVVLITGGGGGLGKAAGIKMAQNGCKVFIGDIRQDLVDKAVAEISQVEILLDGEKGIASGRAVDVTKEESVEAFVNECLEAFGRIDYIVAAAGIYTHVLLEDMDYEEWLRTVNVNLNGVFLVVRKAIPDMIKRGSGAIVSFSSQAGIRGSAKHTHYGATKAALQGFTRSLMYEVAGKGIRVNCVAPGVFLTPICDNVAPERFPQWLDSIPMHRFGEPYEAANAIAFLLSEDASYITGQTLPVNGGSVVNT